MIRYQFLRISNANENFCKENNYLESFKELDLATWFLRYPVYISA